MPQPHSLERARLHSRLCLLLLAAWIAACSAPTASLPSALTPTTLPFVIPTETPQPSVTPTPTTTPTIATPSPSATPTLEPKQILVMPTPQAIAGQPVRDSRDRKALYDRANSEIARIEGIQSAAITTQMEGEEYQAIGVLTRGLYGVVTRQNFLTKPDGTILILNDQVDVLEWSFDLSGINFRDNQGNIFGRVTRVKDIWTVKIEDYGIVQRNGLLVGSASFPEGQPLRVKVKVDADGNIVGISVMVAPNKWADVNPGYFNRIMLTDQALKNATMAEPTRIPTKEPTSASEQIKVPPAKLMTYGGERDFAVLPGTIDTALVAFPQLDTMKFHAGMLSWTLAIKTHSTRLVQSV